MKKILFSLFCLINLISIRAQISVTLGTSNFTSGSTNSSPVNIYYRSHHCQILYTQAELIAAGWNGQGTISKLGFNIFETPAHGMPNFSIKLKNTLSNDITTYDNTGLTTVYSTSMYQPVAGGFEMLNLNTNFLWDGTSNILVDVCFDQVSSYSPSGQVYMYNYTSANSEYQYAWDDNAPQCAIATNQAGNLTKPQIRFVMTSPTPCSGTPNSGTAFANKVLVCPYTSFDLSLLGGSIENSISYQWQSSPDGNIWSNIGTAQSTWDYTINSITDTTYYRCISTCSNSVLSNTSTPTVVNYNPLMNCYCMPSYSWNCSGDKIIDFSLANLVNQSNNCDVGGFSDWTSVPSAEINLTAGNTYTLITSTSTSSLSGAAAVAAWIDYNQNGTFDGDEFTYLGYGDALTYSNTITVPITATSGSVRMRLKLDANYANIGTSLSACDNNNFSSNGQILDYKVNITAAPACSGAPNAGNAVSTETAVCKNKPYTLDLINNSVASNITYQWQASTDNTTWANLGTAQNTIPYSISTQSVTTYYRCITTCTTSAPISGTSTPVMVSQNLPTACYCTPDFINCSNGAIITNVTVASVSYTPACQAGDNYFDITSNPTYSLALTANQTYTISTDISSSFPVGYVGAWIDYNQDGIFDDQNEYISVGNIDNGNLTVPFTVPFTAIGGNTRLRLKMESVNGSFQGLNSCSSHSSEGQTIDYLVNITPLSPCAGTPNAGDATGPSGICENSSFTLNLANNDIVSNMSYQWQSSTDNTNWSNLGTNQTFVPYLVNNQSVISYYRCLVTCLTSSLTSSSTTWTVTQNPVTACYCIPEPTDCSSSDVIKYVAFATMTNTSGCDGTNGYSDYTSTVPSATVSAGQFYTLTTALGYMYGEHTYAWIDYNQDGIFNASEYTDLGPNNGNDTISYTINIPVSATPGTTRMRIRDFTSGILYDGDACNSPSGGGDKSILGTGIAYGETEDYLVTILPPDCGIVNFPPTVPISGAANICLGQSAVLDISSAIPVATGLTYQWKESTGGSYTNVGPNASTFSVSTSVNTSYYCEISCNATPIHNSDTVLVNVNSVTISPIATSSVCNGSCNGSITLNATSASSLTYVWQPSSVSTSDVASGLCAGNYTVNITDALGACSLTNTFVITQPSAFTATIAGSASSICEQLEDTITSTINGGLAPLSYSWTKLPSTVVSTNPNYTYTTSIGTFSYGLAVTDANNCVANSNTVSITVNPSSNLSGTVTTNTVTPVAGRVVLYKYLPYYTTFDSIAGQNIGATGNYNFVSFTSGTYIIKAIPTATNMQIAYGDSAVNWKTARQINHGCAVNDIQNIEVKSLPTFTPGPGTLTGVITQTLGYGHKPFGSENNTSVFKPLAPGQPIGGIIVKGGRNPGGQMFVQTTTDTSGHYKISGLPYGDYFILVDITGLDTNNTYHVKITPQDTVFKNLDFTVDSIQINPVYSTDVGVHNITAIEHKIKVFPNPASNYLTIQYDLSGNSLVKIELFDLLGQTVKTLLPPIQQGSDSYKASWQLDDLKSGLYFIKTTINGRESTIKLSVSK